MTETGKLCPNGSERSGNTRPLVHVGTRQLLQGVPSSRNCICCRRRDADAISPGLTLTAEAEHAVATTAQHQPAPWRPSTANSSTYLALSRYIQLLIEAIDQEQKYPEDAFQAKICLSWIHWQLGEAALGAQRVPRNIEEEYQRISASNKGCQDYTKADVLKAAYIKGSYLAKADAIGEAMDTFNSVLPIFTNISSTLMNKKEIHTWAELYLTEFCLTSSKALKSKPSSIIDAETLSAFRAWATFWEEQKSGPIGGRLPQANVSRRLVWLEYYHIVSQFLQQNLPYSTTALIATHPDIATRQKQKAELIRVESKYEALLLSEVQFPEAEAVNDEVEAFVKLVMQNWHILCSDSWQDPDKSQGDAETISRAVLDILYRAAKKTFHSTHILRHLVTVHLFIGEFDLAFKAFDTYLDLVKKGKERIKKTGEPEPGLDNDEEILKTASECMRALCKYGPEDGAEKAHQLAIYFEEWLDKDGTAEKSEDQKLPLDSVSPNVLARTWSSVGMAHAQWSRAAFDATARANIQLRAIACFRKALRPEYGSTTNVETLFALGTLLAERRELTAAIEVVKAGLLAPSQTKSAKSQEKRFLKERSLIPLWHLLALLVSARQEFVTAARSCEGAFEQFIEPSNLFGDADLNTSHASNHQNTNEKSSLRSFGIVDEMDDFEKGNVLEVKMTQLALVEVLEGPEIAVNASGELLSLYGRLFGSDPEKNNPLFVVPKTATSVPPHSATGTLKSKTGSVFNRPLSVRNPQRESTLGEKTTQPPRPDTTQTATAPHAPAIQITGENGNLPERRKPSHEKLRKRSGSLQRKDSEAGRERSKSQSSSRNPSRAPSVRDQPTTATQHAPTTVDGEKFTTPPETPGQELMGNMNTLSKHVHNLSLQENTSFGETQKGLSSSMTSHKLQGPSLLNDLRVKLPRIQQGHRRVGTLIKVWLLIAGFYRRALMYDDARGAVEEAQKLVERLETGMLRDVSRNITIDHAGWGGGKSVNELWGDVYAEVCTLRFSPCKPKLT